MCVCVCSSGKVVGESTGNKSRHMYKLDKQLFRRNTRGASSDIITKFQFADDVVLLATTREAAEG